jgi:hypothetical protein
VEDQIEEHVVGVQQSLLIFQYFGFLTLFASYGMVVAQLFPSTSMAA